VYVYVNKSDRLLHGAQGGVGVSEGLVPLGGTEDVGPLHEGIRGNSREGI
jgi:hypothetical protein